MAILAFAAPTASADRAFTPRFATNDTGDIVMAANTLLSCQGNQSGCAQARAGAAGAKLGNNSWDMEFVDVDSDAATFDSSRADLTLPADASILFAGLYWGANTTKGDQGEAARDAGAKNTARFATPTSGAYVTVTADRVDEGEARSQAGAYQAFADVTALVSAGGAGAYTLANVQSGTGLDRYAGWSLVVAYHSPTAPPRNLTVFDGFETVNSGDPPQEISMSGFRTPPSGPVRSKLGFVAYEGDRSLGGDQALLNGRELTDGVSGSGGNFFNSSISLLGQPVTTKDPNYNNQLGFDADVANAEGYLRNGATSAALKLSTSGDTYLPGVAWIATELFAPDVQSSKSVSDLNGGLVEPGDELEYVIAGANRGQDAAANMVVTDPVPANTTFVPGSLRVTAGAGPGPRSDATGDDAAEFDAGAGQVVYRVGADAGVLAGGRLAPNEGYEVRYRVRVAAGTPSGTAVVDQARVTFLAETLGFPVDKTTNDTRLTTSAPDLAIQKEFAGSVLPNVIVTYTITVANVGDAPSRGEVVVTDPLPGEINFFAPTGNGWSCVQTPALEINCRRSDSLAPGASYPPIVIQGLTFPVLTGPFINTSTVSGGGDVNESNNSSTAQPPPPAFVSLALEKEVSPDMVAPGEEVAYLLTVANRSGLAADGVQLRDPLPAGLTAASVEALDQGTCDNAVSCSLGTLAAGGTARVRIRARVGAQLAPGDVSNTATVNGSLPDVHPEDNTDTGTFRVRTTARLAAAKRLEGTPTAGQPVRWTVGVRNDGPHGGPGGEFVDELPANVEGASASVPGGSCTVAGRTLGCALPPIPAGGQVQISVTGGLPANAAAAQLLNGVQVTPNAFPPPVPSPPIGPFGPIGPLPPPPAGGSSTPPGEVIRPAADVGVAKVATPDPLARNGTARWHVRTTNHGPSTATNLTIRDTLPSSARFLRSHGTGRCAAKRRVVTCRLGNLGVGRSVETEIVARLGTGGSSGTLGNTIVADAAQNDPAEANNSDRARSALAPRLRLSKSVNASTAERGDRLTYALRIRNRGPSAATGIRLCDRPRRGLMITQAPGARRSGRAVCWTIRRLARGRTTRRKVQVRVTANRPRLRNVATVRMGGTRVAAAARVVRVRLAAPPRVTG
jgi:uncharacterized repeat protein (TIGR01451 family)